MRNKRQFNYDTLPVREGHTNVREVPNRFLYDMPYAPCPCRCHTNQAELRDGRKQPNMHHHMSDEGRYMPGSSFQTSAPEMLNHNRHSNTEQQMLRQFLTDDGQVDVQKMLQTIGQFADTVQQVSPVIKQINDLVKSFRT